MEFSETNVPVTSKAPVCHEAVMHALRCLNSSSAVAKGDHLKERTRHHEFKIYWPRQLKQLRLARGITDEEMFAEVSSEFIPAGHADYPKDSLFSWRKRLQIRDLSTSEMTVLKSIVGHYVEYMTDNPDSFIMNILCVVRIGDASNSSLFRIRKHSDYSYIVVSRCIYSQVSHDILNTFLLSAAKSVGSDRVSRFGAKTNDGFTLDHELAMNPKERKLVLDRLERDITFLRSLNLDSYCLLYAITMRKNDFLLQLPGAPYGPEINPTIEVERQDTIPHRHDVENGMFPTRAQLIALPYKNYEFLERLLLFIY